MIVHHTFTSTANGRYYPAGFYILETEYQELSEADRACIDRPITPDESAEMMADEMRYAAQQEQAEINLQFNADFEPEQEPITPEEFYDELDRRDLDAERHRDTERFEDDRFDDDNADARRHQDDWDREHEAGDWDYRNG